MSPANIRNFSIIAHIDHGKSTLADRLLETTGTIEKRKMQEQVLDSMELERERGITIKMQPVRMKWRFNSAKPDANTGEETMRSATARAKEFSSRKISVSPDQVFAEGESEEYILNLIDTPGHIDFSYEVSRSLRAVEGSILLVDATQGVQAQTLTTLNMAREAGLKIIPTVSKIDSPLARTEEVIAEVCQLLDCKSGDVLKVSGKTGEGVEHLLNEVIRRVPAPSSPDDTKEFRSLIFDFQYSNHTGVIVYTRVMNGSVGRHQKLKFKIAAKIFEPIEVGIFAPDNTPTQSLGAGEIGYIVTGIKEPGIASVGDTISSLKDELPPLAGYRSPSPVVWASIYPESQDDLALLRQALGRLRLSDSSFTYEEEASGTLGKGYRCGFLGMLHMEIVTERLRREFDLELIVTHPSITYDVELKGGTKKTVYSPSLFPDEHDVVGVSEPIVTMKIITPPAYLSGLMKSLYEHEAEVIGTENFGDNRTMLTMLMPLRELMRNFFDEVKSISSGYASISYDITENRPADVVRLDVLVADEVVPAFSRVVSRRRVEQDAETVVEKLYEIMPRELFTYKIQSRALGRIISSRSISGRKKDAAGTLSGGDITRKMKLREKQKEGRKRLKEHGSVIIPQDVFVKMMRAGE
ncbi:MAG: elongation factor 4 [Candidatus Taylorbacteria bacterium RIFCSPHIGHO2_02_FULL_45_28]|uniref:Elongation factor 4 n=1 Tax=Candidatus Taylorbacteria bacterium RIFCSPHIGHO2_12_FULL_45_16 TaxID=1802315 RepID=A0A1G2MXQ4_9BACT|nr:MAG: elongation factor 4 [Candidatus Taylorbacteria bacterium RIFCSPHIGHO2_01_FULL_44_110]OHA25280.1 MAG: elongation factor 4 [Candidatus Taylorbacteria bacterium RIFCSPHIGHO2_02_FULL_45_28]OHA28667.1 MAG: elongation factor 4 [Candidatus Taylorbacteria bacterium RIFCSPHIGHO2_12_FULL_45_16]OHA32940.1 MAG: elongation factor 4 [Candidatus Taylorbacteria bacterium RIFCSPLOWO2_01_FULL_45_59]OHA38431.1 MAG: elongation factor 4 [Candidatus Taylorbacteria bacterium RIFCSPLOWO2_02_FULL_45_10b]